MKKALTIAETMIRDAVENVDKRRYKPVKLIGASVMTTPVEEGNAMIYAGLFIKSLLFSDITPKIPAEIRRQAKSRLRHYPSEFDIKALIKKNLVSLEDLE